MSGSALLCTNLEIEAIDIDFKSNIKMKERKINSWMIEMNKQIEWQQLHIRYEVEEEEKEIAEW